MTIDTDISNCKTCPHDIGDTRERDCAFPDCVGGWENAFKQLSERFFEEKNKLEYETQQLENLAIICARKDLLLEEKDKEIAQRKINICEVNSLSKELAIIAITCNLHGNDGIDRMTDQIIRTVHNFLRKKFAVK